MKKKNKFLLIPLLVLTLIMSTALFGCDGGKTDPTKWKLTFDYNYTGAPAATVVDVEDGKKVAEPTAPTRANYDFAGWFTDSACSAANAYVFSTQVKADKTLYAGWTPIADTTIWKVTFDYNYEGAPASTVVDVVDGEAVARPSPAPSRAEYDFKGWFTDPACTSASVYIFTTEVKADKTLYASWTLTPVFIPDPDYAKLNYDSSVTALAGTWKVSKVYAGGTTSNAVANAITLSVATIFRSYVLMPGDVYIHNDVYDLSAIMTFGLSDINAILNDDDVENYKGASDWTNFALGEPIQEEGAQYSQPGPAIMDFGDALSFNGLFLDKIADVSISNVASKNRNLIIGMNNDGQLLLGYSDKAIEFPGVNGNWTYCLIFDKV